MEPDQNELAGVGHSILPELRRLASDGRTGPTTAGSVSAQKFLPDAARPTKISAIEVPFCLGQKTMAMAMTIDAVNTCGGYKVTRYRLFLLV